MKSIIPQNYPRGMNTSEIENLIHECQKKVTIYALPGNPLGASYWMHIIALGQAEINDRLLSQQLENTQRLADETNKLREENNKSGKINLGLSIVTILLAVVSAYLGFQTTKTQIEKDFEIKQMEIMNQNTQVLKQISDKLEEQNLRLSKVESKQEINKK